MEKLSESVSAFDKFKEELKKGGDERLKELTDGTQKFLEMYTKTYSPYNDLELQLKTAVSKSQVAEYYNEQLKKEHEIKYEGFVHRIRQAEQLLAEKDQMISNLRNQALEKSCKKAEKLERKFSSGLNFFSKPTKSMESESDSLKKDKIIGSLQSEVDNLKQAIKDNDEYHEDSVSKYAKKIHDTVKYMHELRVDYEAKDEIVWKALEDQKLKIDCLEAEKSKLQDDYSKALSVIGKQELQLEDLRKIRDQIEDAEESAKKDSECLNFDVALLTRQVGELKEDNRDAQKEIIELSAKILVKNDEIENLKEKVENLQEDILEHEAQEDFLNENLQRMEAEHAEAMQELQVIIDKQDDDLEKYRLEKEEEEKEHSAVERYFAGLRIDDDVENFEDAEDSEGAKIDEERKSIDSDGWKKLDESDDSDVEEQGEVEE